MRVVRRNRQGERAGKSASVRLGSDWAEARQRSGSSSISMATLTRQCPVEANLIFEDGPRNSDRHKHRCAGLFVDLCQTQKPSRTALCQAQNGEASRLVLMTTQSASGGGETYVVVGDKIGCSQPSIYSSAFTELAHAAGPIEFFGTSISSLNAPSGWIEFPLDHKIEIRAPDKIRRSELSYQCRSPVILTTIVRD
jgi:hypothetical protein